MSVRNLKIDPATGDLVIEGGQLATVSGTDAIAQAVRSRLAFFRGEWFADKSIGLPFYEAILVKNPNLDAVREFIRSEIAATPGIVSVTAIDLRYNGSRSLAVTFRATTDLGELVEAINVGI